MSSRTVDVVDVGGCSNLRSVAGALQRVGASPRIIQRADEVGFARALILPGAGSFKAFSESMITGDWPAVFSERARSGSAAVLGICLGLQVLMQAGEEGGGVAGLGLLAGTARRVQSGGAPLPRVGWYEVETITDQSVLFQSIASGTDFYFLHSYCVDPSDRSGVVAESSYGERVVVAVEQGNVMGVQFHPEKSSLAGLRLLRNFVDYAYR